MSTGNVQSFLPLDTTYVYKPSSTIDFSPCNNGSKLQTGKILTVEFLKSNCAQKHFIVCTSYAEKKLSSLSDCISHTRVNTGRLVRMLGCSEDAPVERLTALLSCDNVSLHYAETGQLYVSILFFLS